MPSASEDLAKVQLTGILQKRPVNAVSQSGGLLASKWYKRFFVIKDGFLMYYPESEKREFERRHCANYHPKGLMPLGDCLITRMQEPESPHMISIVNELSQERLVIQCENSWEQEKWVDTLEKASRICYRNAQLGDTLIQQLQVQGAKLAEEKQEAMFRLHDEVSALSDEKARTMEMEALMAATEAEKKKVEEAFEELSAQLKQISAELEVTVTAMKEVEAEKVKLADQQTSLSGQLSSLEEQKQKTEQQLRETQEKTFQLDSLNRQLSTKSEQTRTELAEQIKAEQTIKEELERSLKYIVCEMDQVLNEKEKAEQKVQEQIELASLLQDEKKLFHQEAQDLEKSLQDIKHQKDMTEAELREEIKARLQAEQRLFEAEQALKNLESKLEKAQNVTEEQRSQLMLNVKALKRYFEEKAIEEKIAADKPIIMKRAVYNKRRKLRAQSMRYIRFPDRDIENEEDDEEAGMLVHADDPTSTVRLRHSASNIIKDQGLRALIAKSAHGDLKF